MPRTHGTIGKRIGLGQGIVANAWWKNERSRSTTCHRTISAFHPHGHRPRPQRAVLPLIFEGQVKGCLSWLRSKDSIPPTKRFWNSSPNPSVSCFHTIGPTCARKAAGASQSLAQQLQSRRNVAVDNEELQTKARLGRAERRGEAEQRSGTGPTGIGDKAKQLSTPPIQVRVPGQHIA